MKFSISKSQSGFSLVELMTVVAIMGTLAAIAVPRFTSSSDKIKAAQVQSDMSVAIAAVSSVHLNNQSVIQAFIGAGVPGAGCVACNQGWNAGTNPNTWGNIAAGDAAWKILGYASTPKDPWGNYYILDDNDWERDERDCRYDAIYSAGPDGLFAGANDGDDVFGDDIIVRLPRRPRAASAFQCPPDSMTDQWGGRQN